MAEGRLYVSYEELSCSICLDLLNDPVTIPCGHNYCINCIRRHWDQNANRGVYNCPQCRQNFHPRPVLGRNVMVAEMVERFARTRTQTTDVSQTEAGPGDVQCDVCPGRIYKAIKTCLLCLISLCQIHFQQHENAFKGERHCLIDATDQLRDMICIQKTMMYQQEQTDQISSSTLTAPPETTVSFEFGARTSAARKTFSKRLKKKMDNFLNSEVTVVSGSLKLYKCPTDGPRNRNEILQYSHQLSMDSNTVNGIIQLSGGNRVATNNGTVQQYPDHPERFDCWPQVLCKESVCGRAYWEVEWSGSAGVGLSLSYNSIGRKGRGDDCKFGCSDQSMNLYCSPTKYALWDKNKKTKISVNTSKIKSSRLGVYVDYSAGIVSFFSISDKMRLIYIFPTTFTQPIYPGFRVYFGSAVKLCEPAVNCR